MSRYRDYNLTFLFDSNIANGDVTVSNNGASFNVDFDTPLLIPKNAENINIQVKAATVWFNTPNIIENSNNQFLFQYDGAAWLEINLPTGLYDTKSLSVKIQQQIQSAAENAAPPQTIPTDVIELLEDSAESKVVIRSNYLNVNIDFRDENVQNNIRELLGFDSRLIIGNTVAPEVYFELADNPARFNTTDYYLITCSKLLNRGLNINGKYFGVMVKIDINADINTKITYDPNQIPFIPADELAGIDLSSIAFDLVDQNRELVDTRGETYTILFEIHYRVPK